MCRWGCTTTDTTYMCKWCGTRYCRECLRGDFEGHMRESTICRKCFQPRCQGVRVEYVPSKNTGDKDQKGKRGQSARGRSASAKRGRSASSKRGKSAGRKKSGKKSGKKRKK